MRKLFVIVLLFFAASCSREYQKLLKSTDYNAKYEAGMSYYQEEDYFRAKELLEPLFSIYKGTDKGEVVLYHLAHSYLKLEDYMWAGYYFKTYTITFPTGSYIEDCEYYVAFCYFQESPRYNLDQEYTQKAVDAFQTFLNKYPNSERKESCNTYIDQLHHKLERKAYENAKLYYTTMDYKSAVIALKNMLKDYPDTEYREEALFLVLKSSYLLAENSVESKQYERYEDAVDEYYEYIDEYSNGQYSSQAEKIFNTCKKVIN